MKNETLIEYFYILPFSGATGNKLQTFTLFFLIYVVGVLINSSIITVICLEVQLHKPMYLFIGNLSIIDICYTSITVPKLLHMLLSGNHIVSFSQCYTQFYFFLVGLSAEDILLFFMAYDRYVAICNALYYNQILSWRNCILITIGIWVVAFSNAFLFITLVLYMTSCHSNIIHQFYCDIKSLTKTSCRGSQIFFAVTTIEIFTLTCIPLIFTFISYVNIFSVMLKMKSRENRRKAFSTCSSHITVITVFYGAGLMGYMIPSYLEFLNSIFNIIYTTIVPMMNPIIYSLQNSSIQSALLRVVRRILERLWTPLDQSRE